MQSCAAIDLFNFLQSIVTPSLVIDVRASSAFAQLHICDAINADLHQFDPDAQVTDDDVDLSDFLHLTSPPPVRQLPTLMSLAPPSLGGLRAYESSESDDSSDDDEYLVSPTLAAPASFPFYSAATTPSHQKFVTPTRIAALSPNALKLAHVYSRITNARHREMFKQRQACTIVVCGDSGKDSMALYMARLLFDEKVAAQVFVLSVSVSSFGETYPFLMQSDADFNSPSENSVSQHSSASSTASTSPAIEPVAQTSTVPDVSKLSIDVGVSAGQSTFSPQNIKTVAASPSAHLTLSRKGTPTSGNLSSTVFSPTNASKPPTSTTAAAGAIQVMKMALPNEIIDSFLFLGADRHAKDATTLTNLKITHVLNCAHDCENHFETPDAPVKITYLHLNVRDIPTERISAHFQPSFEFIESALQSKGRILVHCAQGISRSVTIVIGYLMATRKWTLKQAFDLVRSRRSIVCPNMGFFFQLGELEIALGFPQSSLKLCLPQVDLKQEYAKMQELVAAAKSSAGPASTPKNSITPMSTSEAKTGSKTGKPEKPKRDCAVM